MRPFSLLTLSAVALLWSSCALPPTESELAEIKAQKEQAKLARNAPVSINRDAIPNFTDTPEQVVNPTSAKPKRKFSLRTPDLVDELPSEQDLENKPDFSQTSSNTKDEVRESTTIKATD